MKLPKSIKLLEIEDEELLLDRLNELSPTELLDLQSLADRITELNLIIYLAREEYGVKQDVGTATKM